MNLLLCDNLGKFFQTVLTLLCSWFAEVIILCTHRYHLLLPTLLCKFSFSEPLKRLYGSQDVNEKSARSKGTEAPIEHLKGKRLSQQMRISAKQRCLHVLRKIFSQFVGEIIEAMAGYIPLPAIMAKLLSDNGNQEFGDFKLVIHRMLSMYLYEKRILV